MLYFDQREIQNWQIIPFILNHADSDGRALVRACAAPKRSCTPRAHPALSFDHNV